MFDVNEIREDFPIFEEKIHGCSLTYLDNAATMQLPRQVLQEMDGFYRQENSNIHRGIHTLSNRATGHYERARETVADFIHAEKEEIVFTSGTTDAVNKIVFALEHAGHFAPEDEILVSAHEHHSNLLPWQQLARRQGCKLRVIPYADGALDLEAYAAMLSERTRLAAFAHVTNVTGAVNPIAELTNLAHERGIPVLIDGAQGVIHDRIDVKEIPCDFYCFSGHKMMAPTGIGVCYIKKESRDFLDLPVFGGGMVKTASYENAVFEDYPLCMEAGTPNYAAAAGLASAIDYLSGIGHAEALEYENALVQQAERSLAEIPGLTILGHPAKRGAILSFVVDGIHPFDLAHVLDGFGVAVRSGSLCAVPALHDLGVELCTRASFSFYNTAEEIDILCGAIRKAQKLFGAVK